jgi:Ca-activated chloride channel family protein
MSGLKWHDLRFVYVAAGVVLVLAIVYALDLLYRRRLMEKIGHAPQLARMTSSVSPGRQRMKAFLTVIGVALLALAIARPQTEGQKVWKQRGIDLVVVMDFSKSMLARDVYPSRIKWAQLMADTVIDKFYGDRIGLIAFGGESIHYPLTSDHEALKILYHGLDPVDMAPGTDIGDGVLTARCLLAQGVETDADCLRARGGGHGGDALEGGGEQRKLEAADVGDRGRAILLFTDGEDTEGHAAAEIDRARKQGVEVYIIGVGTAQGAWIPEFDRNGEPTGGYKLGPDGKSYYTTRLDERALKDLANSGGTEDHYFHGDPRVFRIESVVQALSKLKEGNLEQRSESIPSEAYHWLLFPGFAALLIEACLSDRRRMARLKKDKA